MCNLLRSSVMLAVFSSTVHAGPQGPTSLALDQWIQWSQPIATQKMLANISPPGTPAGIVVASPSKSNPDYFYHWIRDAALTSDVVVSLYARAEGEIKNVLRRRLFDYVDMSIRNQKTPNKSGGVGEPKFLASGDAFNGDWGRPQDDGPALRAMTLIRLARILILEGQSHLVSQKLYTSGWDSVIKTDLEYVSHNWRNTSFDLWEEVRGHHFYTRMVQRKALLDGADLANQLGDAGAAFWYREQGHLMEDEIMRHWNGNYFVSTLDRDGGIDYKTSGIDASVVLGLLQGHRDDGFLPPSHDHVIATVRVIEDTFKRIYPINNMGHRGIAIGRYPEDRYTGFSSNSAGNPWFINTNAFAEYYYLLAKEFRQKSGPQSTSWAQKRGDDYLACTQFHMGDDGSMAEQMNRNTGFMQGAPDLTWSYASLLTAQWARY
ncbi:MAG: glycoside hydrolase family 15 protein [Deltaproteobacteria bacterium]|nr:glycoside hydrolase family 15 protein [Deltaproteobacteria bacterium]MBI3293851.1 glycoside hydrolase family 15 protein [Deltaproteobacteria bacterium]